MANIDIYLEEGFASQGGLMDRLLGSDRLFSTGYELAAFAAGIGYKMVKEKNKPLRECHATAQKNALTIKLSTNAARADTFVTDLFAILEVKENIGSEGDQDIVIESTLEALKEDSFSKRCQMFNRYVHTGLHHISDTHNEQNLPYSEVVLRFALEGPFCFEPTA